jgi:hypothetical protein
MRIRSDLRAVCCFGLVVAGAGFEGCATSVDVSASQNENSAHTSAGEIELSLANIPESKAPILAFGHGAALLADGTWAEPSPGFVRSAQAHYIAHLDAKLTPQQRSKVDTKRQQVSAQQAQNGADDVALNREVIRAMVDEVDPVDSGHIKEINEFLYASSLPQKVVGGPQKSTANAGGVGVVQQQLASNNSGVAYFSECAANGVPNPPTWGTASWVFRGNLTAPFISTSQLGKVYTYTSTAPRGICIALPRINQATGVIDLLGIICQGSDTNKTCFWDSANTVDIAGGAQVSIPSSSIIGGAALAANGQGVCTACHAGENNFIIHPRETALNLGDSLLKPMGWVSPIVSPSWPQNRGPGKAVLRTAVPAGQSSCVSCHSKSAGKRFPKGSPEISFFCNTVATIATGGGSAAQTTMPPPSGGGAYGAHVTAIRNMCAARPAPTGFAASSVWHNYFSLTGETPMTGDFNGDGRSDIITFTRGSRADAIVALSSGTNFGAATLWHDYFGLNGEQLGVGDFNGDGRDDVVVFPGNGPALIATSNGSSFAATQNWGGHVLSGEVALTGDFNNDRYDDIVVFTKGSTNDALVALSNGSSGFGSTLTWHGNFSLGAEVPGVGDFNGDGYDDIVTFVNNSTGDVYVALSNGSSFGTSALWHDWFAPNGEFPAVADVNGDGLDDIVTYTRGTAGDVWVALSNGSSFGPGQFWHDMMGIGSELPAVADVDGDERADAVVFSQGSNPVVWVAKANN